VFARQQLVDLLEQLERGRHRRALHALRHQR
jgi:hypothetical protein